MFSRILYLIEAKMQQCIPRVREIGCPNLLPGCVTFMPLSFGLCLLVMFATARALTNKFKPLPLSAHLSFGMRAHAQAAEKWYCWHSPCSQRRAADAAPVCPPRLFLHCIPFQVLSLVSSSLFHRKRMYYSWVRACSSPALFLSPRLRQPTWSWRMAPGWKDFLLAMTPL